MNSSFIIAPNSLDTLKLTNLICLLKKKPNRHFDFD
jgi:hypothetical protein